MANSFLEIFRSIFNAVDLRHNVSAFKPPANIVYAEFLGGMADFLMNVALASIK